MKSSIRYSIDSLLVLKTTRVTRHQFAPARSWCDIDTVWLTVARSILHIIQFSSPPNNNMGNALVANADKLQTQLWTIQFTSGNSISWAIGTVLTQYCVSEWIWRLAVQRSITRVAHSRHVSRPTLGAVFAPLQLSIQTASARVDRHITKYLKLSFPSWHLEASFATCFFPGCGIK